MDLELSRFSWPLLVAALVVIFVVLASIGAIVTPVQTGDPELISPDRWTASRLARQAQAEAQNLVHDTSQLRDILEAGQPDPVAAMLLAQRLYAKHREGTSATGGARLALINAGEICARYAVGELPRQSAITVLNDTLNRIEPLLNTPANKLQKSDLQGYSIFTPIVRTGAATSTVTPRPAIRVRLIATP